MTIGYVDPNGDGTTQQWNSSCGNHYQCVDDGVRQPNSPSGDDVNAKDGDENAIEDFLMETLSNVDEVTSVKMWVYHSSTQSFDINVKIGGSWQGYRAITTGSGVWEGEIWSGSWTQSDLDGLQTRLRAPAGLGKTDAVYVEAVYCEITYTEVSAGWGHKIMGVANANIGKIMGVPKANISKVQGV